MLNVGIVCAGDFAERHARAFTDVEGVTLVAACRTDARALARFTNRFGGTAYTDYRALLADERIDAVLVATPHHLHADATIAAAQAGKHIFLEKPMASTLRDCDRILAAVENANVSGSESKHWTDDALKSEWRAFVNTIENDAAMPITGEYARDVVAVALAAKESARVKFEVSVAEQAT